MEIVFLFYFVFSLLVAVWNRNRGNSFLVGFILSLFLSPLIGALIVAVTSKNPKNLEKREMATGQMKKCPMCAEMIRAEAKICRFCNHKFE
jgi:hypothetical protein